MVDYSGLIATTVFTQGCNFRCGFCHNRDLMTTAPEFGFIQEDFFEYLSSRKKLIDGICVTGGEPTLWKDLPDFIRKVKKYGLKLKLDTNGSNPEMIGKLLRERLIDYIAVDIKTSFSKYHLFKVPENTTDRIEQSVQKIISSKIPYEFRTTCVPEIVTEDDIYDIAKIVKGSKKHYLQQFRPYENVLDERCRTIKPYTREKLEGFKSILESSVDEVALRGV